MREFMLVITCLLLATPAVAAQAPELPETWYVRTRVATDYGPVINHYWSKGSWFRAETVLAGHRVITIVNATHYYICDMVMGKGTAIERSVLAIEQDAGRGRPFARELDDLIAAGGEKIHQGPSNEGGLPYRIYQLTNENGRRRVVVTDSEPPLPIRVETFVRSSGDQGILEYAGWQRDLEIHDSFFEAPAAISWQQLAYEQYVERVGKEPIGPAPVYYRDLLHGKVRTGR
ncbi:MAG: hypothetical protein GY733_15605 [bacterium]|nr:hypothetical protein [bacterium]